MPTYAYRCTRCNEEFDIYQRFDEESLTTCPRCGASLRKLFTPSGIVFKGQGFYRTDSRSKPASSAKPASSGTPTPPKPSSTSTKSD